MKRFIANIWLPLLLVMIAATQSFGIDAGRAADLRELTDSIILTISDSIRLSIKDSLRRTIPDSLEQKDSFFFKYYIAVKDSLTREAVRDSLTQAGDTLELYKFDSLYRKDSAEVAEAKFNAWYTSLSRKERKKYDTKMQLPILMAEARRKLEIKDSIRAYKDSVKQATPRVLETFAFPDSLQYKRIVTWKHDQDFHNMVDLRDQVSDTSFNYNFHEYPFMKNDVNAVWLGVAGSPMESFNFFKRQLNQDAKYFTPYESWSYTPETMPMYNTKTPYTELAYWGTLFANKEKEEANVKVLTTQNITPELNLTLQYTCFGGNGMLQREDTGYRTFVTALNYVGKKYLMHAGYIYNRIHRSENGGIIDLSMIRDTTVDAREIDVYLTKNEKAESKTWSNTVYLDQSYRIPFNFINKLRNKADTVVVDSLSVEEFSSDMIAADTVAVDDNITTAFIGHSSEFAVFRRSYTDDIGVSNKAAREFFNDRFYLNPTQSHDSVRVMRVENKAFIRLQPWKEDGIISKLDVGLGDKLLNFYSFRPLDYLTGPTNINQNSVYLYAGAKGQYDKYLKWDATGKYNFLGHEINDFDINANVSFSFYPFRRDKSSPLTLKAHFETNLKEPNYYDQHLYTNHYVWNNDFGKISTTKLETSLSIPKWKLDASFNYALLSNNIYYDNQGIVRQNGSPMSVMSAYLRKDFTLWKLHFENKVLFQLSSDQNVVPLPLLALNLRYYLEFDVVKNVMKMQIGAHGLYNTKWYAPGYNPVVGVFHNQNERMYGNCPYIDAFVNIQWKRVSVFVKAVNINMGWPFKTADYFSADGYINTQTAFKFGISWPFWTFPAKKGETGASSGQGAARGGKNPGLSGGRQRATN